MNELCKFIEVKQKLLTVYHSQTDESTEVLNQYIDQWLHSFMNHFQNNWSDLLSVMNYTQTILSHEFTKMSSYELKLRQISHLHFNWKKWMQSFNTVKEQLMHKKTQTFVIRAHNTVKWAKSNLKRAQNRMMNQTNKHWRESDFIVRDWVYVTQKDWSTERSSLKLNY